MVSFICYLPKTIPEIKTSTQRRKGREGRKEMQETKNSMIFSHAPTSQPIVEVFDAAPKYFWILPSFASFASFAPLR
jgi:hypothetical protein